MEGVIIENIGGKRICIGGIGKMFYEQGLPVSMAIQILKEKEIEVSILHIADECLKNGWPAKTTINKLVEDFQDNISFKLDKAQLGKFCYASYEEQREMIFSSLFENQGKAKNWLMDKIKNNK